MHACFKGAAVCFLLFSPMVAFAGPAVLIEDGERNARIERIESDTQAEPEWNRPANADPQTERRPAMEPSEPQPETPHEPLSRRPPRIQSNESWSSLAQIRGKRRVGVGASFLGRAGFIGLDAELNVHPRHSILASVGGGPGYDGASIGYKWIPFDGGWHPTLSLAMAGWAAEDLRLNREEAIPAFFRPGHGGSAIDPVRQVYFIPGVGLQSLQLAGDGVGGMIFVEFLFFTDISTFDVRPIGSVGAKYFF